MRSGFASTFRSLKIRNYRFFATGQLISLVGGWMQIVAQDWLVLQVSHNSGTAIGAVTAAQFVPILLLSLYAGKLADRLDKRKILMAANAIWLVLATGMGMLIVLGSVTLWQVMIFALIWGSVSAVETPTRQSFISELVAPDLLPNALSLNAATFNSARIVGPALAGVAIALMGTGNVFVVNGITYLAPLAGLYLMRPADLLRTGRPVRSRDARIRDGLSYVRGRRDLLIPMVLVAIIGMVGFNFQMTMSLMARKVFGTGAASFGLFSTALAIGALGGALASTVRRQRPTGELVIAAAVVFGVMETVLGFGPTYWTVALLAVPTGFSMVFFAQAANQRVQLGTDAVFRGRVMALYAMVFLGTTPLGAPLVGWSAQTFGPRSGLWLGGVVSLLTALVVLGFHLRRSGNRLRLRLRPTPAFYLSPVAPDTAAVGPGLVPAPAAALVGGPRTEPQALAAPVAAGAPAGDCPDPSMVRIA